jgi:hypothetical protein
MYSTRQWCRREILLAKEHNRPIVILNCFEKGETRSFPYMGNVLTVHYGNINSQGCSDDLVWEQLMTAVLKETLRLKYAEIWISYVLARQNIINDAGTVSAYPPELITLLSKKNSLRFLYPDPPLGNEELDILRALNPAIAYLTPSDL